MQADRRLRFAGQITGVEGYVESASVGLITGRLAAAERLGQSLTAPPVTTAMGALINHITGGHLSDDGSSSRSFQPMNVNFGLFPPIELPNRPDGKRFKGKEKGLARKKALSARALKDFEAWLAEPMQIAAE